MKQTGKLDYLEMPATGGTLDSVKAFYSAAFAWSFTDYGPTYSAFSEGLDGGFQAEMVEAAGKPLPVLYSEELDETASAVEAAGGRIVKPIFSFPGGRRFHFLDPAGNELAVWGGVDRAEGAVAAPSAVASPLERRRKTTPVSDPETAVVLKLKF